jgi:hypothetical protein
MRMAQNWAQTNANQCQMYHSSNRGNAGENLYATSGRLSNGKDPVQSWYNEIKDYHFGGQGFSMATGNIFQFLVNCYAVRISDYFFTEKGHFTQVVWKASTELGVGWATGRNGWTYFCCNYAPAGNYQGQFRANVLPLGTPLPASVFLTKNFNFSLKFIVLTINTYLGSVNRNRNRIQFSNRVSRRILPVLRRHLKMRTLILS